jgi:hypothetical protein
MAQRGTGREWAWIGLPGHETDQPLITPVRGADISWGADFFLDGRGVLAWGLGSKNCQWRRAAFGALAMKWSHDEGIVSSLTTFSMAIPFAVGRHRHGFGSCL